MIPLYSPFIGEVEKQIIGQVIDSKYLSRGYFVEKFENEFASYCNKKYAIAVNSGTAGLHLCMRALELKQNDEVITSDYSFVASANCILYEQATPILQDINQSTFLMNFNKKSISKKTKVILPKTFLDCNTIQ